MSLEMAPIGRSYTTYY